MNISAGRTLLIPVIEDWEDWVPWPRGNSSIFDTFSYFYLRMVLEYLI